MDIYFPATNFAKSLDHLITAKKKKKKTQEILQQIKKKEAINVHEIKVE